VTSSGLFRRNWRLKIAALAVTVLLWATIRVGAISRQDLPDVAVRVENDDPDWVPTGLPSPSTVQLSLTGPARELFRVAVDRPVVVVPIDRVLSDDSVIVLRSEWVRNANRAGVAIEDITPSSIRIQFERNEVASIPVSRRPEGSLPDTLSFVSAPQVNPLFTNVRGPASTVNEVEAIFTEPFDLSSVTSSGRFELPLDTAGVGLRVTPSVVTLTVNVAPTVERSLSPRLVQIPDRDQSSLELVDPSPLPVTIRGAEAVLEEVDTAAVYLEVHIDPLAREMVEGDEMYLAVLVSGLPDLVEGDADPDSVLVRRSAVP